MKHIFSIRQKKFFMDEVYKNCNIKVVKDNKRVEYYNIPVSFDIETTSFYSKLEKCAIMYEWSFAIYDYVIIGRTWEDYKDLLNMLINRMYLNSKRRLIIYVHNLSYEFQFMRKHFKWEKVFGMKEREVLYALDDMGIMYKCSYLLSGYSLAKVAENLKSHKIRKMVGDLDYSLVHTPLTPLTPKEIIYCINDVRIVTAYIEEEIESNKKLIFNIPLTQTGFIRRYVRNRTLTEKRNGKKYRTHYYTNIHKLLLEPSEYKALKRAFMGGFTHANSKHVGDVCKNVSSFDFTSSYPAVMLSERFPMSSARYTNGKQIGNKKELDKLLKYYLCVFDVQFFNLREKFTDEHYISESRCYLKEGVKAENGRVYKADKCAMTITNIDLFIIEETYIFDSMVIGDMWYYYADYLPKQFIDSVINLYEMKNKLKHVEGKEVEYMKSKQMLNSTYGMAVTDIVKDLWSYSNRWECDKPVLEEAIDKYNKSAKRFLFYPWGIFVTAYARRNLWLGILECKEDYIYSDTDSIKILNKEKHDKFIVDYNKMIESKLKKMCNKRNIDFERLRPKGKLIGVWDYEGTYDKFKTLGAKRYMLDDEGNTQITVSGLNKHEALPYILKRFKDCYKAFNNNLFIPPKNTGKLTHTYIDDERKGFIVDYKGIGYYYDELSSVHLENAPFTLNMTKLYLDYLFKKKKSNYFSVERGF